MDGFIDLDEAMRPNQKSRSIEKLEFSAIAARCSGLAGMANSEIQKMTATHQFRFSICNDHNRMGYLSKIWESWTKSQDLGLELSQPSHGYLLPSLRFHIWRQIFLKWPEW